MQVAADLFYRQGYRATGVNEVIEKSGVAKATFYKHFPSKDDLGHAYIQSMRENEIAYLTRCVSSQSEPVGRFLAVIDSLRAWLIETDFRGCPFINMVSEIPDPKNPLRKEGMMLYDATRDMVLTLAEELLASDAQKYGHLDAQELTKEYMVIFAGAVGLAGIYHSNWPVEHALISARRLIGE
ncbi:MAG: helix-turn-helix domain-containing protein [Gammaproteobacteria bacterium]